MYSALSILNTTTEVPLSKAPNPQLLPGRRSINGWPLLRVCVHGVCVCSLCALWMGQMQSTNSKYGSPYLVVYHFHFTLYLQNLNSRICTSLPVPVFGCLQNLIVKFKDHDYYVLTD